MFSRHICFLFLFVIFVSITFDLFYVRNFKFCRLFVLCDADASATGMA